MMLGTTNSKLCCQPKASVALQYVAAEENIGNETCRAGYLVKRSNAVLEGLIFY